VYQSIKVPYLGYEHGQRTFDMPTCLVPSGLGPVLICLFSIYMVSKSKLSLHATALVKKCAFNEVPSAASCD